MLTWILVLGILRECLRLVLFEPFARQYLYRKDMVEEGALGAVNGTPNVVGNGYTSASNGDPGVVLRKQSSNPGQNVVGQRPNSMSKAARKRERSAVRFAEQGWQFTYYIVYWPLGMVKHN